MMVPLVTISSKHPQHAGTAGTHSSKHVVCSLLFFLYPTILLVVLLPFLSMNRIEEVDGPTRIKFSSSHHSLLNEYSYRLFNGSQAIPEQMMLREATSASQAEESDKEDSKDNQPGSWLHYQLPLTNLKELQKDCTHLRYFSDEEVFANQYLESLGIVFLEYIPSKPQAVRGAGAIPASASPSSMPTFHWVEFLILAYTQLQQIQNQRVAWLHVPHAEEQCSEELTGKTVPNDSSTKVNCLVAQFVLGHHHAEKIENNYNTMLFYGREANNYETALLHPQLRQPLSPEVSWIEHMARSLRGEPSDLDVAGQQTRHETMMGAVDAVLTLQRPGCRVLQQQSPNLWMDHFYHFPAHQWHADIAQRGLQLPPLPQRDNDVVIRIGYLRPDITRVPQELHDWLLGYLEGLQNREWNSKDEISNNDSSREGKRSPLIWVEFVNLVHLDELPTDESPDNLLRTSAQLDILIGQHSDSLSHLFFMPPKRAVVELFWETPFEFEFATASQLMMHDYMAVYNGLPLDSKRIAHRDLDLKREYSASAKLHRGRERQKRIERGRQVVADFVEQSVHRIAALRREDFLHEP